ncbi:unnamed protein product [Caenorhabditis auriculariae]|uniref:Peptidase M20 dimerisation domain-containing protein n=1 Tax=Caenorhabditis auriculariae TaxID=2777116 RepID=A0A8S1GXW3_9PELO|nr:unnamed protein product [Caenorhabditis auriculariae]
MNEEWQASLEKRLIHYMSIDSTTGIEEELGKVVCEDLSAFGFTVTRQLISESSTRFNILATYKDAQPSDIKVLLNTHLDSVPPHYSATQTNEIIHGRGATDAKGALACLMTAAFIISKKDEILAKKIGLLIVVGEETDHIGMQVANKLNLRPTHIIVGEPTELKFGTIQKGAFKCRLSVKGKAGHSGYLDSGISAIHGLLAVLNDIMNCAWPSDERFGSTTYNVGKISGGQALNAWAENATAELFFRITTSVEDVKATLAKIVDNRASIEYLSYNEAVVLDTPPFEAETTQVAFNTDLPYFEVHEQLKGRYLFGAGSIKNAHSMNDFVPKKELYDCTATLIRLIEDLSKD